ncbi:MAG: LysM peptidoglycan-binding domain-containing protein [Candidatus Aminicenantes bacterium]|nr:LysM peptidoglycan-binding domain-containing protein [Candidatus Aminicenantes bacterium]NIM81876.1 LysM peptidoglycan-binding domain-containing protein [Candidatus Aminicenantes bacterium]NIN21253.1 LysM peptidoglycan-binding domain-containing protein [Candidatus Aminicenantes bacterium]NIN45074.1 LysM peptidoglycan-binding domain-containing protein [Candidatus Aminicenantes bacterium]NIN87891.1 LysM peptidoglycan-binding domain-containing protein [Candidatus Aminicenantes bacterium]
MLVKAFLTRKDKPWLIVPCMFNPEQFTVEKSNQFAAVNIPGLSAPLYQFVRGNARSVSMDLFFDTYEEGIDVRIYTDRITGWDTGSMFSKLPGALKGLMDIDSDLHAPPVCLFVWGTFIFQCIIEKVTKKFTMFHPSGFPVRATLSVSLKEYREPDLQIRELKLMSADLTKTWVVKKGDSLWSIAAKEYGDPADWRLIADANHIANPRVLKPGQELVIPVNE